MAVAPSTTTVSLRPPTSRVAVTELGMPALSATPLSTAVLKPVSVTVTEYVPGSIAGIENDPCDDETVSWVAPVPMFVATTVAPGMAPPVVSTTVPASDDVTPCAKTSELTNRRTAVSVPTRTKRVAIVIPQKRPSILLRSNRTDGDPPGRRAKYWVLGTSGAVRVTGYYSSEQTPSRDIYRLGVYGLQAQG